MEQRSNHHSDRDRRHSCRRSTSTRRQALRTLGAVGGIALTGCLDQDGDGLDPGDENGTGDDPEESEDDEEEIEALADESHDPPENGAVVFVYDDGPIEDYTQAFPVHEEFGVPATTGIVTDWIGRDDDWMDVGHLEELADAGWEICSHTTEHTTVAMFEIEDDIEADDHQIFAEEIRHGHHEGKEVELTDGTRSVLRTVEGLDGETEDRHVVLNLSEN